MKNKNTRVIDLQLEELEGHIEDLLDSSFAKAVNNLNKGEELLSRIEVTKRLGIAPSTLNDYTHKGILTSYQIGHRVFYKWNEIIEAAKKVEYLCNDC